MKTKGLSPAVAALVIAMAIGCKNTDTPLERERLPINLMMCFRPDIDTVNVDDKTMTVFPLSDVVMIKEDALKTIPRKGDSLYWHKTYWNGGFPERSGMRVDTVISEAGRIYIYGNAPKIRALQLQKENGYE